MPFRLLILATLVGSVISFGTVAQADSDLDLSNTVMVAPVGGPVGKAAATLSDAVHERTGIRWYIRDHFPGATRVVLCTADQMPAGLELSEGLKVPDAAEGFALDVQDDVVVIVGQDPRGVLYGVGRLLRAITMRDGEVTVPTDTQIATSPKYGMRVHQLGYRNTATSYDLWTVDDYEQYLRELSYFGCSGAELIQESPPGEKDSVLMAEPQWDMNVRLAKLLDDYDLDVFPVVSGPHPGR